MWSSFVAILLKEFKHIFRDRGTLIIFFTMPIMQLALFGFLDQNVRVGAGESERTDTGPTRPAIGLPRGRLVDDLHRQCAPRDMR